MIVNPPETLEEATEGAVRFFAEMTTAEAVTRREILDEIAAIDLRRAALESEICKINQAVYTRLEDNQL